MNKNIKRILRENMSRNYLNVKISRPSQILIIMRGVP